VGSAAYCSRSLRERRSSASRHAFGAIPYSHALNVDRPLYTSRLRHARRNVSQPQLADAVLALRSAASPRRPGISIPTPPISLTPSSKAARFLTLPIPDECHALIEQARRLLASPVGVLFAGAVTNTKKVTDRMGFPAHRAIVTIRAPSRPTLARSTRFLLQKQCRTASADQRPKDLVPVAGDPNVTVLWPNRDRTAGDL
jgi:hypothetical protein